MLKNPLWPAILLVIAGVRIFTGNATWFTAVSILAALVWLVTSIKARSSERAAAEPRASDFEQSPAAMPVRTREQTEQLIASIDLIRRMQREQSMPPPPLPTEEEILATARPAIFLRRSALPVPLDHPGRSYLGGLPRLPPELPWPEIEKHERLPLTFLAQIDLAELPVVESSPLPRAGTLYFFADMNDDSPDSSDCRVLYFPGDISSFSFRELPESAQPYGIGGEPWPWFAETSAWSRTSFRFPLEFTAFDSVRDYLIEEGARVPPKRNTEVSDRLMAEEFSRRFGPPGAPPKNPWQVFQADRDEWPFAWAAIDYGARSIIHSVRDASARREAAGAQSEYQRIGDAASKWIDRAAQETPHTRCDGDIRMAFLKEWRQLTADFNETCRRQKISSHDPARDLHNVLIAACFTCASNNAADVIPETYRNALEQMNDASTHFPRHQMLGHGEKVQWAPIQYAQDVLLLQLLGDGALGWHSNSGCAYQFWISMDALRQGAFESVEMTLECD